MAKIGVIGAGSWGYALAVTIAGKGHEVKIWDLDAEHLADMKKFRENRKYLPGVPFPETLNTAADQKETLEGAEIVLFAAPAQHFRSALQGALPYMTDDMVVVNVAKGIEQGSLKRMSEVAEELKPGMKYVVLAGPSHAEEVGKAIPTTVAVASKDPEVAKYIQEQFSTDRFRIYTANDLVGIELGGAIKNVIALGAGITDGMGFGDNTKAALMTRGLAEMKRLGLHMGADPQTFLGLACVGDLIVTCTSMHSRNRRCGLMIGEGMDPKEATKRVGMVVEGMFTAEAAKGLAEREGVEMPITFAIYDVVNGVMSAREAAEMLFHRALKSEME